MFSIEGKSDGFLYFWLADDFIAGNLSVDCHVSGNISCLCVFGLSFKETFIFAVLAAGIDQFFLFISFGTVIGSAILAFFKRSYLFVLVDGNQDKLDSGMSQCCDSGLSF